jgi:hypothetical protein
MMRKIVMVSVVVWLLILPMAAFAEEYFSVGGGAGGKADAPNLTLELGGVSTDREHNRLIAIGLGFIFNADDVPSDTLEYPVPHSDYTNLGTRQKGNEYALFGKYGLEVIKNKGAFIFALGGLSFSEEIDLARSNVTGWYYEQSSSSKVNGMFGGGLSYFPINSKVSLSVEYDNRRGITGSLGFRF